MTQRAFFQSVTVIRGRVQDIQFDVLGVDDLPSLATVAVTSFMGRVGAVTMQVGDLTGLAVTSFNGRTDNVTFATTDMEVIAALAGTYTNATVTVDQYGRVTIAASGTAPVTSVTSSGGTITVTGTTTANVEIALGHANTWTAAQKYTAGGKTLQFGASTTTLTTDDTELIMEETGDSLGTVRLKLRNRGGLNGALFQNASVDLVDFGFLTSTSKQGNQRFEDRGSSNNFAGTPEFQFIVDGTAGTVTPTFCVAASGSNGVVGLNNRDGDYGCYLRWLNYTTVATTRTVAEFINSWATKTDATRKGRLVCNVYDTAAREAFRIEASGSAPMIGFLGASAVVQQTSGADLTNNVTSGGTSDTIADYSDLVIYANDAAAIRNDIYQLARKLKQVNDALRLYGLLS